MLTAAKPWRRPPRARARGWIELGRVEIDADIDSADEEISDSHERQHLLRGRRGEERERGQSQRRSREGDGEPRPPADMIDGQRADQRAEQADRLRDQTVA